MNNITSVFFHARVLAALAIAFMLITGALPASADGDSLYDGLYDRPSFFPGFTPSSQWPSTMSYFVCARVDGERLHNYEVAVYDSNDSLRQCGRSISSQQELCTLTIPGEAGDKFHFVVIYGDTVNPSIAAVPETCEFVANDNVGTLASPFWLTLPSSASVRGVRQDADSRESSYYTLSGVRIQCPTKPGIYIKDGKKIVIE